MPMPLWWGQINKRIFNPRALRSGRWHVIRHVGRVSGRPYRTPLEAHEADGGYVFVLVYGSGSDWVRNVLARGEAQLEVDDGVVDLVDPKIVDEAEAFRQLPADSKPPPRLLRINEFLTMRTADETTRED